jgi:hypothetical protein
MLIRLYAQLGDHGVERFALRMIKRIVEVPDEAACSQILNTCSIRK